MSEEVKLKNVFKVKKCFKPFRNDIKKIAAKFVEGSIEVRSPVRIPRRESSTYDVGN
jgi:hypothetical protein